MASQVFYRRWRPQTLAEVVGQEHVTQTLHNALITGRVAHAYLFCGPRGTGKTSTGRILAKAVNCSGQAAGEPCNACSMCQAISQGQALDLIEIDAASNRGIDDIRDLRQKVNFAPSIARYKVYIIDEVHMLTEPAFNALLKTLEEPPPYTIFILATTEAHKIPATILSRCQRFDFRRIPRAAMEKKLGEVCDKEGIHASQEALGLIAKSATGSLRDAENLLEQLVIYHGPDIDLHQVQAVLGITGDLRIRELAGYILSKDIASGLATINSASSDGLDLHQFNRELVEYLRQMLLIKAGAEETVDLPPEAVAEMRTLASAVSTEEIVKAVKLFAQVDLRFDAYSTLPLELALVECASPSQEVEKALPSQEKSDEEMVVPTQPLPVSPELLPIPSEPPPISLEPTLETAAPQQFSQDTEYIRRRWNEVVEALKGAGSKGNLDAYLRSACEPVALEGNTIVLGFYYEFHKSKIEDPKYRHLVENKLNEVFHTPYQVRCILIEREKKTKPSVPEQGQLLRAALEMGARVIEEE